MKRFALISFCLLILTAAYAADGGVLFRGYGEFSGSDFNKKLGRFDGSGWLRVPFTEDGNLVLSAEARYSMEYETADGIRHYADMPLLKLSYTGALAGGSFAVSAGRFFVSDITGIIFSQPADGVAAEYSNRLLSAAAAVNYTGLINSHYTTMTPVPNEPIDDTAIYALSVPLISGIASISFPQLFANQTLSAGVQGYCGIREIDYQRLYVTLMMNGPIAGSLFYTAAATGELLFGSESMPYAGIYGSAELAYYLPFFAAKIALKGESATKNFDTITEYTVSLDDTPCKDITKFGLGFSMNIKTVLALMNAQALFATSTMDYRGFQLDGGARWQIVSDVQLSAAAGYVFPALGQDGYGKISINALIAL